MIIKTEVTSWNKPLKCLIIITTRYQDKRYCTFQYSGSWSFGKYWKCCMITKFKIYCVRLSEELWWWLWIKAVPKKCNKSKNERYIHIFPHNWKKFLFYDLWRNVWKRSSTLFLRNSKLVVHVGLEDSYNNFEIHMNVNEKCLFVYVIDSTSTKICIMWLYPRDHVGWVGLGCTSWYIGNTFHVFVVGNRKFWMSPVE